MPSELDRLVARWRRDLAAQDAATVRRLMAAWRLAVDHLRADLLLLDPLIRAVPPATTLRDTTGRLTPHGKAVLEHWRGRRLLSQAEQEVAAFTREGLRIIADIQARAVADSSLAALAIVHQLGPPIGGFRTSERIQGGDTPSLPIVSALHPASPLWAVFARLGAGATDTIQRRVLAGITAGRPPLRIVNGILRDLAILPRARIAALVTTELYRAFRTGLFSQYAVLGITHWRWIGSKRGCLACLSMDGRIFPMTQASMPAHINCLCLPVVPANDMPYESGADWFARQAPETQRAMLPSQAAYDAYQAGQVTLDHFCGMTRSRTWGPMIAERSGAAAMEAVR